MIRRFLPLALVLSLVAAACAEPPEAEIEFGAGRRFVPLVADPLNNAGVEPAVVVTPDGAPVVAYFAFEEETEEGELPATRPVGAPSLPGLLMATVSEEGVWTRGALVIEQEIPNSDLAFAPAFEPSIGRLTADAVAGLAVAADGETIHAAWGTDDGIYHVRGSLDPATTEQATVAKVSDTAPHGLSIGVDASGAPWIAYLSSTVSGATVELATQEGEGWSVESIAESGGCEGCRTAVVADGSDVSVAYSNGGDGVAVATNDGESAWVSFDAATTGGEGLSAAASPDGIQLLYHDGAQLISAVGPARGPFRPTPVAELDTTSGDGAATSVAVAEDGTAYAAWEDAVGVRLASSAGEGFEPVETAPDTEGGAMPTVAVAPDGSRAFLGWYETENEDLLVGAYGELTGLALAEPSPTPTGEPLPVTPPSSNEDCEQAVDGTVSIQASGIAFDTTCLAVPPAEPFSIEFGNQDAGVQHNVSIYPSAEELGDPIFEGDIITGPDSITYDVDPLDVGEYYFHCDVHPQMNGSVVAGEATGAGATGAGATGAGGGAATGATGTQGGGDAGGGGGGVGGGAVTVTAQNLQFDTDLIELPADTEGAISFSNQDAGVQHNISIFADDSLSENLFQGDLITGPDEIEYTTPPLEAGEYYFHCDVHPTMNGAVSVG